MSEDLREIAERVRAFARSPRIAALKTQLEALRPPENQKFKDLRQDLKDFSIRLKIQLGQRGNTGTEPAKKKRGRGRPVGPQFPSDQLILEKMNAEMLAVGTSKPEAFARRFAKTAAGGGTEESKTTRLAKAYRKRFGCAAERK